MKTVPATVPRDAFIAVYTMRNTKRLVWYEHYASDSVFMGGRDNGPAMTGLGYSEPYHGGRFGPTNFRGSNRKTELLLTC
jgi:hypothetical protein